MQGGVELIKPLLADADVKSDGKVVFGSVKGDLLSSMQTQAANIMDELVTQVPVDLEKSQPKNEQKVGKVAPELHQIAPRKKITRRSGGLIIPNI